MNFYNKEGTVSIKEIKRGLFTPSKCKIFIKTNRNNKLELNDLCVFFFQKKD